MTIKGMINNLLRRVLGVELRRVTRSKKGQLQSGDWDIADSELSSKEIVYCIMLELKVITHYNNDSFYEDESIAHLPRDMRKTYVKDWEKIIPQKKRNNYAKL
jgi:predicted glycosyl hydrolase (DUF1957 family)